MLGQVYKTKPHNNTAYLYPLMIFYRASGHAFDECPKKHAEKLSLLTGRTKHMSNTVNVTTIKQK